MDATKINSLLECGLCLDVFDDPRNLPCGHTFCFKCIQKLVETSKDKQPSCALCRTLFSVPSEGLQGLMRNFVLNNFVQSFGQRTDCAIKCALFADGDEHGPVEYFCIDCWDPLCANCFKVHKKTRYSQNHDVKKMTDITEADVREHRVKEEAKCSRHNDKVLELFCNECNCAVCYICCATSHFQHRCLGLTEMDEKFIEQIRREIDEGVKIKNSYDTQLDTLYKIIKELETDCAQKLIEIKLKLSKVRQENKKCFTLIEEKINKCERDAEDGLLKLQKEETARLESVITSLQEKMTSQQQANLTNEQYLPPFASVFQRVEACAILKKKIVEDKNSIPLIEKIKIPSISVLQYSYYANFNNENGSFKTSKLTNSFIIPELSVNPYGITTLSVNNNKILAGSFAQKKEDAYIYCCNTYGDKLSTFNVQKHLISALWINNSQFMYTCSLSNESAKIVSETGDITLVPLTLKTPQCIYVSINKPEFIYIADYHNGLYRSVDGGKTWSLVFNLPEKNYLRQAIPLIKDENDGRQIFWTRTFVESKYCLQECVVDKQGKTTWRDINMTTQTGNIIQLDWNSVMVYDESDTIFVSSLHDNAVYGFSVKIGKQDGALSITEGLDGPSGLTIDNKNKLLYVGNKKGVVKVFNLLEILSVDIRMRTEFI